MPSKPLIFSNSRSRWDKNPCPDGLSSATLVIETVLENLVSKNISFLVCVEGDGATSDSRSLEVGLGVGLGVGIPVFIFIIYMFWRAGFCCNRDQLLREDLIVPIQGNNQEQPHYVNHITERERIFNTLGSRLHRDFLAGNMTEYLRCALRTYPKPDLLLLENYAISHNKFGVSIYIRSIIDSLEAVRPATAVSLPQATPSAPI
jgi:hypothetical protein